MDELADHEVSGGQVANASPRVLVVDDSPSVCEMLCQALELDGYCASACARAETWLDHIMQCGPAPALILLDLSGSSTDGVAFLHCLRARWKTIPPIIVMTTNKEVYEALAAVERVICKPFHLYDLSNEVHRMLPLTDEKMLIGKGIHDGRG